MPPGRSTAIRASMPKDTFAPHRYSRVYLMRRTNWKTVSTLVTMVVVAGCSDTMVSPSLNQSATSMQLAPEGRPTLSLNTTANASARSSIRVGPKGGVFLIGNNAVVFPRNSICEPTTSGYGVSMWDAPCTPLRESLTIAYETSTSNGRTSIDFKTPLRFVPSNNPAEWVWVYMYTPGAVTSSADLSRFTIYYAPTLDGPLYDETAADATLRTYVDSRTGVSARRIKHFSGYTVYGVACNPNALIFDPNCTSSPSGTGANP
jgi:hypothetical protein